MNIALITKDLELIDKFKNIDFFSGFYMGEDASVIDNKKNINVVIISDKIVDENRLLELRKTKCKCIKHVFYMITEENYKSNIQSLLEIENIKMIPPKLTKNQIVEFVCSETMGVSQNKNIITFFGADSKVGTTQIAQSVAELISSNSEASVFLAFLNGKPSTEYFESKNYSLGLDPIKTKLLNNIVSVNELLDVCIKKDKLYILPGSNTITNVRYFYPKHIEYLLQIASNKFDIVIIDAGSNIEVGMSIGALNATPLRYLVTTQQENSYENFMMMYQQILSNKLNIKDFMIIVNKYMDDLKLSRSYDLADKYGFTLVSEIPFVEWGWQAEIERKSLLQYDDSSYNSEVERLSKLICNQLKINYIQKDTDKVSFFRKLFK